jgi:hypothetical protein
VAVSGLQAAGRHDVDRDAEEFAEFVLEVQEVEQGAAGLEVDEEVDVAAGVVFALSSSGTRVPEWLR